MRIKSCFLSEAQEITYTTILGEKISISYIYSYHDEFSRMYLGEDIVWYMFDTSYAKRAKAMEEGMKKVKKKTSLEEEALESLPKLLKRYELREGGAILAIQRPKGYVPLAMLEAFTYQDIVRIVSRLEDLVCVLEMTGHVHGLMTAESLFVEPGTGNCSLLGGWWNAHVKKSYEKLHANDDLLSIRELAILMLGKNRSRISKDFERFLNLAPAETAREDRKNWKLVK